MSLDLLGKKVLIFSYSNDKKIYSLSYPVFEQYCKRHNYDIKLFHKNLENNYRPHWNKIHYSIDLLENDHDHEYIVWLDHDIIIKNFDIKIEDIILKYKFNTSKASFMMSADPIAKLRFNNGVIIFKNNKKSLEIFREFLMVRDNPKNYPLLEKHGGFDFHDGGLQDTRPMVVYFETNKDQLLSVPHRVLQSFYGISYYYKKGDFCGHLAGVHGKTLMRKLKLFKNNNLFYPFFQDYFFRKEKYIFKRIIRRLLRKALAFLGL